MAKRNHPGQAPRVNGWGGYTFSRARHLAAYSDDPKTCLPTYPGPGQRPDSNFFTEANYDAPKHWPVAGQLLRPPQVAWMSCLTLDDTGTEYIRRLAEKRYATWTLSGGSSNYFTGEFDPVPDVLLVLFGEYGSHVDIWGGGSLTSDGSYEWAYIDGETNTYTISNNENGGTGWQDTLTVEGPSVLTSHSTGTIKDGIGGHSWWIDTRVANPMKEIFDHFHRDVFPAVKSRVEALRPGRTWVEFHDWADDYSDPPNEYWSKEGMDYSAQYLPMLVSRIDEFYGTNFLHVYIGVAQQIDGTAFDGDTSGTVYAANRSYLTGTTPKYAGYRVMMYGLDPGYGSFDAADPFPFSVGTPTGPTIRRGHGPFYVFEDGGGHHSDPEPYNDTVPIAELWNKAADSVIASYESDAASTVDDFNSANAAFIADREADRDTANTRAEAMAEDLADLGFSYEGDGKDLDADALVGIIAAHFGFDPDTGADLG